MEEAKTEITLELGAIPDGRDTWHPAAEGGWRENLEKVQDIDRYFGDKIDFRAIPYEGTKSLLSGGRKGRVSPAELIQCIKFYNRSGLPFMVPFNGGLCLEETPIDISGTRFKTEQLVLEALANSAETTGQTNVVTVLRDELRDFVRKEYPNLRIVGSCIRYVGGRKGEFDGEKRMAEDLDLFDEIVPLNQHTVPQFLSKFEDRIDKIIVFLCLGCACNGEGEEGFYRCYRHHVEEELFNQGKEKGTPLPISVEEFSFMGSKLDTLNPMCFAEPLERREEDLRELLDMGVRKFKLPRIGTQELAVFNSIFQIKRAVEESRYGFSG
ncbi:hypothetical protein HN709_04085 [Candidatus Peregrinibacteria bacterium]|jgi:hypothetical protein|nr:hypothetical protein [Candidatus Peregrinibacteria bacterium]MBT7736844.1 hypothetical protein [Candidatus Peregrinibacteria bacterium]